MKKIKLLVLVLLTSFATQAQNLKPADKTKIIEVCTAWNIYTDNADVDAYMTTWADENVKLVNPFGSFETREAIKAFETEYVTKGMAVGKRHLGTNILVTGTSKTTANVTMDIILMEVVEIPFVMATIRFNGSLIKTKSGWKLPTVELSVDEGFMKLMARMKESS